MPFDCLLLSTYKFYEPAIYLADIKQLISMLHTTGLFYQQQPLSDCTPVRLAQAQGGHNVQVMWCPWESGHREAWGRAEADGQGSEAAPEHRVLPKLLSLSCPATTQQIQAVSHHGAWPGGTDPGQGVAGGPGDTTASSILTPRCMSISESSRRAEQL